LIQLGSANFVVPFLSEIAMNKLNILVFRIRSLLCANDDSWTRFALNLIIYTFLTIIIGFPIAILQKVFYFKFSLKICIFPTNYLGHFVLEADRYISLNLGNGHRTYFTTQPNVANKYFFDKLKLRLKFYPRFFILPIYIAHHAWKRNSRYILKLSSGDEMSDMVLVRQSDPWFIIDQPADGHQISNNYFQGQVKPLITLFARDADFRSERSGTAFIESSNYRDVTANNYVPLAQSLAHRFSIIKMGRATKYQLSLDNQYWFNYSISQDQSDFNDFFLTGNSDICITTDSGSLWIPVLFRKKIIQTNLSLFGLIKGPPFTIVTLKDYKLIASGQLLTLTELVKLGIHRISDQKNLDLLGVQVIENSQEDLKCLAKEIEEIYDEVWIPSRLSRKVHSKIARQFVSDFSIPEETYFANSWILNRPWFFD
jgi:putative glycosyltransferase (TIGR04372 family)